MKNDTNNSNTFSSLDNLLATVNAHWLTNCIRIYSEQLAQHNLTVANVQPLLPAHMSCFMSKVTLEDILKAKFKAEQEEVDYVKPLPYLVIGKAKRQDTTQDINTKLNAMFKSDEEVSTK
mgnify:CR=1 FL=1